MHAATFQEHGKVVLCLLSNDADHEIEDHQGRTAVDFASVSESIWSFFSGRGCVKTSKKELIEKQIIRKLQQEPSNEKVPQIAHNRVICIFV